MSIGSFTLVKNEKPWIKAHILSWLPWLDEMVFFDGNSDDGTTEIIRDLMMGHEFGAKIKLYRDKDIKDFDKDYQDKFNECLKTLSTDFATFIHPDMILDYEGNIRFLGPEIAYTMDIRSFAGEPEGQLFEIASGRGNRWKNIYRLKNPDLGLHYFGTYGSANEDCYFSAITGSSHKFYDQAFVLYPYNVGDSGIVVSHFSDVRTKERRVDRMVKCLINQGMSPYDALIAAVKHPRVTFKDGHGFKFEPCEYPKVLVEA